MTRPQLRRSAAALAAAAALLAASASALAAGGVAIESGPAGLTRENAPAFAFTVSGGAAAECRLDAGSWAPCASPYAPGALGDGPHVVAVRADGSSAFRSFRVDTVAPDVAFSGAAPDGAQTAAVVEFASPEPGVAFRCQVDAGVPVPCTSPWTTPDLRNGTHSLSVHAVDPAGNAGVVSRLHDVAVSAPDTTIEGPRQTKDRTPQFALASTRPRARFECRLDGAEAWTACAVSHVTAELAPGEHVLHARAVDPAGNADASPATHVFDVADCTDRVAFGVIDARAECFRRDGTAYVADGPVKLNGITFNPLAGRPLRVDPTKKQLSLGRIQLRLGSIVLYQGELAWSVPDGERVTLARIDLETFSRTDVKPGDTEGALDLQGDDSANVGGFDLKGEATIELTKGATVLTATVELPKAFTDAEGNGLTGEVRVAADNDRGVQLTGARVQAPLAFIGKLELHDLFVSFSGDGRGDARGTCNQKSPGLRWDGGASAVVVPTTEPLRLEDVGMGFGDGGFSYANAAWRPAEPGKAIGGGIRIQKIGVSICAGPPVRLEGRIGLTALPDADGKARLTVPDAGLIFQAGDPWSLRAEAPQATLALDRPYTFKDSFVEYRSSGAVDFGGKVGFALGLKGTTDIGSLDAAVQVDASALGFIERDRFNVDLSARGCFSGTFVVADALPVPFADVCPQVDGVVSSTGIAVCGSLKAGGRDFGRIGAGYRYGEQLEFMAGACDLGRWRVTRATASAASPGARTVALPGGGRGTLIAVRGAGEAPRVRLRGPGGASVMTPADADGALKSRTAVAFSNRALKTTYVLLARPARGRWTVSPLDGGRIADVRTAPVLAAPKVSASVAAAGAGRRLAYRVAPRAGQRVTFVERGRGVSRVLRAVRRGGRGRLAFRAADGPGGTRRVVALVEQDGLPRRELTVAQFTAPKRALPGRPRVTLRRERGRTVATWTHAARATRHGVRIALPDGRRLFVVRPAGDRRLVLPAARTPGRVAVRVVGLRADNGHGPAATASTHAEENH